jgi:hypothetical protein
MATANRKTANSTSRGVKRFERKPNPVAMEMKTTAMPYLRTRDVMRRDEISGFDITFDTSRGLPKEVIIKSLVTFVVKADHEKVVEVYF